MTFRMLAAAAATSLLLSAVAVGPTVAQQASPGTVEMDVSDGKLERFAVAFVEVARIGESYREQMEAAATDEARAAVQQDAQLEMVAAVDAIEGITVEEYSVIFQLVQADAALADQVQGHIDSVQLQ